MNDLAITPAASSIKVEVYSTVGQNRKVIETFATSWSQLISDLSNQDVDVSGMRAVIGESQVILELPDAQIPSTDFTLFLVPKKVESGYDDDYGEDDDNEEYIDHQDVVSEPAYSQQDAVDDLSEARDRINSVLTFLGNPSTKVTAPAPKVLDEATAALDEKAKNIQRMLRGG